MDNEAGVFRGAGTAYTSDHLSPPVFFVGSALFMSPNVFINLIVKLVFYVLKIQIIKKKRNSIYFNSKSLNFEGDFNHCITCIQVVP